MANAIHTARHRRLTQMLIEYRIRAGMTQADVAKAMGRKHQSLIANIESGQRRIDVVELLDLAAVMRFSAAELVASLSEITEKGT